jgi:hypothetical protein
VRCGVAAPEKPARSTLPAFSPNFRAMFDTLAALLKGVETAG